MVGGYSNEFHPAFFQEEDGIRDCKVTGVQTCALPISWENDSWAVNGNVGVWSNITIDEDLGLVYLPVETPSSDFYGGHRPGDNLFAESLVCVDLKTNRKSVV